MSSKRGRLFALCLAVLLIGVAAGTMPVGAQDDVPSLPASYYGELTLTDGEVNEQIKIDAVADGEIQESIITDSSGQIGGSAISDEKLDVQEPENGTVEFHIGGEPAEVLSLDGNSINSESIPWDSGGQEIALEANSEALEPAFGLSINTPNSVESGDELNAEVEVQNEGPIEASTTVELLSFDEEVVDSDTVTVGIEETTTTTLTWNTDETIDTTDTIVVRAGDTTVNATVEVSRTEPPEIADPPSQGGQGGVGGTGGTSGTSDSFTNTPEGAVDAEERNIVSDSDFNLSQVRFSNASVVESVTWEGTRFKGTVKATTYNQTPDEISNAPGEVVSIGEITAPANATTEPATVQFSVTPDRIEESGAEAGDIRIFHFVDGEWISQETRVIEQSEQKVILQTEVSQLSFFAISAVGSPTATIDVQSTEPTAGERITLTAQNSTNQYGDIIAYEWNVGGESLEGETVNTTIEEGGEIDIELTVQNDAGETDTTTKSVSVGTSGGIPGFTVVLAMIAILGSAFALRRRVE